MKKLAFLSTLALLLALACSPAEQPAEPAPAPAPAPAEEPMEEPAAEEAPTAMAVLHNAAGEEVGFARFVQAKSAVLLTAEVSGIEGDGAHGFHVHENGTCEPDFKAAGGHFNPQGTEHGCPDNPARHAGDFGNIEIVGGEGRIADLASDLVTVTPGNTSVVGKAVIVHGGTDDCTSQPTGAAGARLACGVIKIKLFDAEDAEAEMGMAEAGGETGDAGH